MTSTYFGWWKVVLSKTFQIQKQLKKRLIKRMWMDFNMFNMEINGFKHVYYISEKEDYF